MISDRLASIAYMIDPNKVVYDVGSDHAYLPCFLIESNIAYKVYANDNKEGPLNNAKTNIKKNNLENKIIPVLCDGIDNSINDIDVITISGMGYYTIEHILDNCDVNRYQYFVVQSNSDVDSLRKYISNHNYTIEDERIIYDDFYYQIIKFSADYHENYSDLEIKYGPILLKKKDSIFKSFLKYRLGTLKDITLKNSDNKLIEEIKEIENILYN